jgi:septal ring factor EnvC (AmiA/AmiB activator)
MAYGTKLPPHFGDTKHYCYLHKKLIINKHKRDEYMKLKVAKQQAKDILIAEVKKAKEETNQKLKEEKQKTKEEKQKTKKLKDELANLVKEEKQKTQKLKDELANLVKDLKTNKKIKKSSGITTDNENVVVGLTQVIPFSETTNNKGCIELLKTGLNKGNKCGCKVYNGEYCKRHFKLSINEG